MSQQALDLRRSMQIVRRHKLLVGIVLAIVLLGRVGKGREEVEPLLASIEEEEVVAVAA